MLRHESYFQHGLLVINLSLQITLYSYVHTNAHHNQTHFGILMHSDKEKIKRINLKMVKHTIESVY